MHARLPRRIGQQTGAAHHLSGRGTRAHPYRRKVYHHGGRRNGIAFATGEQRRVLGQLSGVDFTGGDTPQYVVRAGQLLAFAVLPAGKFDAGPDAVLFSMLDRALGAEPLLGKWAAAQALDPRLGG
jgi:hypothetical protein